MICLRGFNNDPSGSINGREFLDEVRDNWILKDSTELVI
jgi:hypothetical protein